jgi:methylthioribose-1-phosphate isomerase
MVKALERIDNKIRLLRQTRLPGEVVYDDLDDYRDIIAAIKCLDVRGAPAIGIAAAYGLALAAARTGASNYEQITPLAEQIKTARPTAVNLAWAVDRVMTRLRDEKPQGHEALLALLWNEAETIHEEDSRLCQAMGEHGATLIPNEAGILTHCNTGALATGGIGTALGVIYTAHQQGKKLEVFADETRPLLQGARLTAWELMQAGIPCKLICDSAAATLMRQRKVDLAIVGADRITARGDVANKIGTYSLAVACKHHDIPFYVAAPYSTFDDALTSGDEIPIEERHADEITEGFGQRTAPEDVGVFAPAFDITPAELVTGFITDQGIRPGKRQDSQAKKSSKV